jgi:hypothetical protein
MAFDPTCPNKNNLSYSDLLQMKENYLQLRCQEYGNTQPANPTPGMRWRTGMAPTGGFASKSVYERNATNTAWVYLYGENNPPIGLPLNMVKGDILYFDGTNMNRLPAGTSGYQLTTFGTASGPSWQLPPTVSHCAVFTASNLNWSAPYTLLGARVTDYLVLAIGGGGGGGGGGKTNGWSYGAGGGGGTAQIKFQKVTVNLSTIPIYIGSGGSAGAASQGGTGSNGGAGFHSYFGSTTILEALGGGGGVGGGTGGGGSPAAGGTSYCDFLFAGAPGTDIVGGNGGLQVLYQGRGLGGNMGVGGAATNYGNGGGGGAGIITTFGTAYAGNTGYQGMMIVWW